MKELRESKKDKNKQAKQQTKKGNQRKTNKKENNPDVLDQELAEGLVRFGKNLGQYLLPIGSSLAVVLSFSKWKDVGWAIIHGVLGWVYVVYYLCYWN